MFISSQIYAYEDDHSEHRHHEAHEHGRATLNILIEDNTVEFELRTPALNVLGFEHSPKTDVQQAKVREAKQVFADYSGVLTFPGVSCKQLDTYQELPFSAHDHDDGHTHHHDEHKADDDHSEYYLTYSLSCNEAEKISQVEVQLFSHFPAFETVDVQWIANKSSGTVATTGKQNQFDMK